MLLSLFVLWGEPNPGPTVDVDLLLFAAPGPKALKTWPGAGVVVAPAGPKPLNSQPRVLPLSAPVSPQTLEGV